MASIVNELKGRKRIDFRGLDRKRHSIRLGAVSQKDAALFSSRIESIIEAASLGRAMDSATATWLASLPNSMKAKLIGAGLIAGKAISPSEATSLSALLTAYLQRR